VDSTLNFGRILILGNSGSGKSWLSVRLAEAFGTEAIDLDGIHWEAGGYNVARDKHIDIKAVCQTAARPAWIIEGVYGWLAREVISQANALIWLDMPVDECIANLRQRGVRRGGDEASFAELLAWAADYPQRQTSSSFAGHEGIFASFPRRKLRLSSRRDVDQLLAEVRSL
jgi:adenylate kinase family enzyme